MNKKQNVCVYFFCDRIRTFLSFSFFKFAKCRRGKIEFNLSAASSLSHSESELTLSLRSELGEYLEYVNHFLQPANCEDLWPPATWASRIFNGGTCLGSQEIDLQVGGARLGHQVKALNSN